MAAAAIATAAASLSHAPPRDVSAPLPLLPSWALFDPRVAVGDLTSTYAAAVSTTSNNREVRVSLRLGKPPSPSCVQLYTDDEIYRPPAIVAADGDLLLIHMVVAVQGEQYWYKLPENFFVYKADPVFPCLHRLPLPIAKIIRCQATCITRCGTEFVVGNLRTIETYDSHGTTTGEMAKLMLYRSTTKCWELHDLDLPYPTDPEGEDLGTWYTDSVFSFRGYMCWADYHRGILFCPMSSPDNTDVELSFLRFPNIEEWCDYRNFPPMVRTVSITKGHLKFVDIDDGRFRSTKTSSGCTITTWTLRMPQFQWEKDGDLLLQDLWSLPSYRDSPLPRAVPTFPVVSMELPNVLHLIVKEGYQFSAKSWMITVDMKNKSLRSHMLYNNVVKNDSHIDFSNVFMEKAMVCTMLAKYLCIPSVYYC